MKDLIRQQGQCQIYAKDAVKSLSDFFSNDANLFYVFCSNEKGCGDTFFEPNAATSIICRVVASLNSERGKALCEDGWDSLREKVEKATKAVVKSDLLKALPLKSMGTLPIHSVAHLTHLCLHYNVIRNVEPPSILNNAILAICVRRLLVAVENDLTTDNGSPKERLHPYLLYISTLALLKVRKQLPSEKLEDFKTTLNSCDAELIKAIKLKYKIKGNRDKSAKAKIPSFWDIWDKVINKQNLDNYVSKLFTRIEERTVAQAQAQIANSAESISPDFDPSSLAFAIATLSVLSEDKASRYRHVVRQGLDLLLRVFKEDEFASTIPFMVDDKGRATFVPSVETANILLENCEKQFKDSRLTELQHVVDVALRFERRLEETTQSVNKDDPAIKGWCNDKAPSKGRVDSWVTAYALEFFYRYHEILKLEKRRQVFQDYSWTSYEKCIPEWDGIIDPAMSFTDGTLNEPIKEKIISLIDSVEKDRRAPVFLLYGPPGVSKTSFVKGVAQRKSWDLISLSPSDFISDSVDMIEHRARKIFHDLMNIDECVILFDEMDSLLLDRDGNQTKDHSGVLQFVVPAFLPKLQELHDHVAKNQMAIFFVTNYGERIDSAIKRKGRIDEKILIPPYNVDARRKLLHSLLKDVRKFPLNIIEYPKSNQAIEDALGKMSALSVYRDVVEFAYCFESDGTKLTLNNGDVKKIYAEGLSISAKTYKKSARGEDGAKEELLQILSRMVGCEINDRSTYLKHREEVKNAINNDKEFDLWDKVIDAWLPSM